eukprot:6189815-Pleurochrysis_carterae.AAC.1
MRAQSHEGQRDCAQRGADRTFKTSAVGGTASRNVLPIRAKSTRRTRAKSEHASFACISRSCRLFATARSI